LTKNKCARTPLQTNSAAGRPMRYASLRLSLTAPVIPGKHDAGRLLEQSTNLTMLQNHNILLNMVVPRLKPTMLSVLMLRVWGEKGCARVVLQLGRSTPSTKTSLGIAQV
jgi:hypothetical protein